LFVQSYHQYRAHLGAFECSKSMTDARHALCVSLCAI
jgi:hypothetical protein